MVNAIPPYRKKVEIKGRVNRWAIGFILLFFMSFLVLLFFQSPLSQIQQIEVRGNVTLKKQEILSQISLAPGEPFFEWDREKAQQQLLQNPQIKQVDIVKSFPGKIVVEIEEWPRIALWMPADGTKTGEVYPVFFNGTVLKEPWTGKVDKPLLRGWKASQVKEISEQLAKVKPDVLATLSEIHPQPSRTYRDLVRVFTNDGNEVVTRISVFHENINEYLKFIDPEKKGIVHMTEGANFGWFEPYR